MNDLRTKRLRLHLVDVAEAQRIVARRPDPEDSWADDFPSDGDVGALGVFLRETSERGLEQPWGYYRLTRLADGRAVGGIGFKAAPVKRCVEIGYGLAPSARGEGFAAEAVGALLRVAAQYDVVKVVATTTRENVASQKTLLRAGFSPLKENDTLYAYEVNLLDEEPT